MVACLSWKSQAVALGHDPTDFYWKVDRLCPATSAVDPDLAHLRMPIAENLPVVTSTAIWWAMNND